jgi:hypothetical protein
MRWFSTSSARKLATVGSTSVSSLPRPSFFSSVEKYGEKK